MMIYSNPVNLNETDRRLLIIAAVILTLIFIVAALIGALIRVITLGMGKRLDQDVSDAVRYRVIEDEKHFRKYARIKNARRLFIQATPPLLILFVSVLFYVIYAGVTDEWTRNFWGEFGTLFYQWDFGNDAYYATVWGMRILASWPALINTPHFVGAYYPSYILCTLWLVGGTYLFFVLWAFVARAIFVDRRARSVFKKDLTDYNYYDNVYPGPGPIPGVRPVQKEEDNASPNDQE